VITRLSWGVRGLIGHPALRAVVVPSRVEPFGRIPMEVFSHRRTSNTAVVAASAGGLAEAVIEGRTGFTFPPSSPSALARAILRGLRSSPEEREQLRAAGRRLVAERYDYETNARRFLRTVAQIEATL
jgi:glycosyltransferase involved in cell wall biosynthesis